jgi:hypothetical protein
LGKQESRDILIIFFAKYHIEIYSIAISGSGFGGLILSNVIQACIDSLGYRWAIRIVGFISFVLLCIAALTVRPLNPPQIDNIRVFDLRPFRNKQFAFLFVVQLVGNFAFNVSTLRR